MALPPGSTIGIIGGGQLGRMLALAAARFGYRIVVLEPAADCPAAQVANRHIVAPYGDRAALTDLAAASDVVTYEFENVDVKAARFIETLKPVRPGPRALEVAQDRWNEKTFLNSIGIATAPFRKVETAGDLAEALAGFDGRGILKTRRLGYDGKGQVRFDGATGDPTPAEAMAAIGHAPAILEALVPFQREISVIAAREADGAVACYDVAENVHKSGILSTSTVPAAVSANVSARAQAAATALLGALDYVGVLGLEFFVLDDGGLLANEFAPRVHNSGHWTEAACLVSQFEQHIRAIAGLPLGDGARHADCVMENLIGDDVNRFTALAAEKRVMLHLYGKAEARPGRKMGHATRVARQA